MIEISGIQLPVEGPRWRLATPKSWPIILTKLGLVSEIGQYDRRLASGQSSMIVVPVEFLCLFEGVVEHRYGVAKLKEAKSRYENYITSQCGLVLLVDPVPSSSPLPYSQSMTTRQFDILDTPLAAFNFTHPDHDHKFEHVFERVQYYSQEALVLVFPLSGGGYRYQDPRAFSHLIASCRSTRRNLVYRILFT